MRDMYVVEAYIGMISEDTDSLKNFVSKTRDEHPELKGLYLHNRGDNDIKLDEISLHKEHQGKGIGSQIMDKINKYADENKKRVILTANQRDPAFGTTSRARLDKFYKGHGYRLNKGRSMDMSVTATHIRDPK